MMYYTYYLLGFILLPAILLAIYAQSKVSQAFSKYSKVPSKGGKTAQEIARAILDGAGLQNVAIKRIPGHLTDHYNPQTDVVSLSTKVIDGTDIASIGVACHEVGHAIQHHQNYFPAKIRSFIIPIYNFATIALWPLVLIGLMFDIFFLANPLVGDIIIDVGIAFFGLAILLNLCTLSTEFDASKKALVILEQGQFLDEEEMVGATKVLKAAALTYIAALLTSVLELVRFLALIAMTRRDD